VESGTILVVAAVRPKCPAVMPLVRSVHSEEQWYMLQACNDALLVLFTFLFVGRLSFQWT